MTRMDPRMAARRKAVQESRARRSLTRLFVLLGVAAVLAGVVWAFRSPLLSVAIIDVEGADVVAVPDLLAEVGIAPGVPLMDVDPEAGRTRLEADPWVSDAVVSRDWPSRVAVAVVERVPVGWVLASDGWVRVAVDGVVLGSAPEPQPGMPSLVAVDRKSADLSRDVPVVGVLEFMKSLRSDLAETAVIRSVEGGFEAVVGGYQVRLGTGEQGSAKAAAVAAIVDRQPEAGSVITVMAPGQPAVLGPEATGGVEDNPEEG